MHAVNVERIGFGLFSFVKKGRVDSKGKINAEGAASEIDGSMLAAQSVDRAAFNVLM